MYKLTSCLFEGAKLILKLWKKLEAKGDCKQGMKYQYIHSLAPSKDAVKGSNAYIGTSLREFMEGKEKFATGNGCMNAELALSMAAWNNDEKMIDLLIEHGASIPATNSRGRNAFHNLVEVM